jgi:hypothetical protein
MTEAQSAAADTGRTVTWPEEAAARMKAEGSWATLNWLQNERSAHPDDLALRGYIEIVRSVIVRDFMVNTTGVRAVPALSAEFLTDFGKFNLTAQEGYLISLIDGKTNVEKLLKLSPFDPFTTYFSLAHMQSQNAIKVPQ